jgi:hypothetical protein
MDNNAAPVRAGRRGYIFFALTIIDDLSVIVAHAKVRKPLGYLVRYGRVSSPKIGIPVIKRKNCGRHVGDEGIRFVNS